jgi:hypothetical protein
VTKVKANNMKMRRTLPEALLQNQLWSTGYGVVLQPELALSIGPDGEKIDDGVEDNASSHHCSNRNIVSPVGQDQVEGGNFERYKNSLIELNIH